LSSLIKDTHSVDSPVEGEYQSDSQPSAETPAGTMEIPLEQIATNPHQPRRDFDPVKLDELAQSISRQGILQPLVVSPSKGRADRRYLLVAGERRLRAARQAGLKAVPCVIREADDQQLMEWAVIENIQRADLNPIERGRAYREYMDRFSLRQEDVAERLGQARATVANYLRILDLGDEVQQLIEAGQVSFGHAKVLASLAEQQDRQVQLARRIVAEGLSVRKLEKLAAREPKAREAAPAQAKPAYVRDLEAQLTEAVGTRVTILPGRAKNTGRIVVEYYSLDDFDRIASGLGLDATPDIDNGI
jgi:ParB family chromosome partitioning protein